jgi:hypothetical protein
MAINEHAHYSTAVGKNIRFSALPLRMYWVYTCVAVLKNPLFFLTRSEYCIVFFPHPPPWWLRE